MHSIKSSQLRIDLDPASWVILVKTIECKVSSLFVKKEAELLQLYSIFSIYSLQWYRPKKKWMQQIMTNWIVYS